MNPRMLNAVCFAIAAALMLSCVDILSAGYDYTLRKRVEWILPTDNYAVWLANANGNYQYFDHAYVIDPCGGGAAEDNKPPKGPGDPPPGYGRMVGVAPPVQEGDVTKSPPTEWPLTQGTGGTVAGPTAQVRRNHAWAEAQTLFKANPVLPNGDKRATTELTVHVAGDTDPCTAGDKNTYSEAVSAGWMRIPGAKFNTISTDVGTGWTRVKCEGTVSAAGVVGGTKNHAASRDPVVMTFVDDQTGEARKQNIFHMDMSVEAYTAPSTASIDPLTGDWFLSANDGKAVIEYAYAGDWVQNRFGRASVINGQLSVEGELAGLPWAPGFSGAQFGWVLSHEFTPSWEAEVTLTGTVPGHSYTGSMTVPFWVEGQDSAPEPATLVFLALGAVSAFRRWNGRES